MHAQVEGPAATATETTTAGPAGSGAPKAPGDRATEFQAVEGNAQEQHSGSTLLVEAYCVLWIILMGWLFMVWRRQAALNTRIDALDRVLDKAAAEKKRA
jgi:hypothetical protein